MSVAPPPISVAEAMSRSDFYPGGMPVTVRETHTAWVFLAGAHAYKVKKPVRMAFLDFSTLGRRRAACREEVRVNADLAPQLTMRLRAVVPAGDSYMLAGEDAGGAVEYAIEMRRFDEQQTMAALVERGELADEHVVAVARRLADFHGGARVLAPDDHVGDVRGACDDNMRELFALVANDAVARRLLAADRFAGAFLVTRREQIAARAERGCIRDGHGDLRAEHVVLEDPLAIVDRLEFDARLRAIDVTDDLAFLVMDLERLKAGAAAQLLMRAYREAGGDPGDDALLSFYGAYRALVRAKVALLLASQIGGGDRAAVARERASDLLALAERFAWRARGPLVLAVSGPPASGKSTLAAAVARRSGWPVLSSDAVRKRRRGIDLAARAPQDDYAAAAREAVYCALGEQARARLAGGEDGVIADATFGDRRLRAAFLAGLGAERRLLRAVECQASAALRASRAQERAPAEARGSDAGAEVAARLGASHEGWDELTDDVVVTLRTGAEADALVDQLADWLDTRHPLARA